MTIPTPFILLGQGGGIRIAETPRGLTIQGFPNAVPVLGSTFATSTFLVIFTAATAGFCENGALKFKLVKVNSRVLFPLGASNCVFVMPLPTSPVAISTPSSLTINLSSASTYIS